MKRSHSPRGGCLIAGLFACLSFSSAFAIDAIPTGTLNIDRAMVREGSRSKLDWQIQYPAGVTDVVEVVPPNIIKLKKAQNMRVRVLGASFQASANSYLPVEVMWSKNNSSWTRLFYGNQLNVNPSTLVLDTKVKKNDTINFGGRGFRDNAWLPLYNTTSTLPNLVMLQNGDKIPSTTPAFQQGQIETFLRPYLLADKKTVSIGDKDLILLIELGQTNPSNSGFDLQDLVVLVTFE